MPTEGREEGEGKSGMRGRRGRELSAGSGSCTGAADRTRAWRCQGSLQRSMARVWQRRSRVMTRSCFCRCSVCEGEDIEKDEQICTLVEKRGGCQSSNDDDWQR